MDEGYSRRDFLRRLPGLFRRSAASFAESLPEALKGGKPEKPAIPAVAIPPLHMPLDGLPVESPWAATAFACAEKLTRRLPFGLLLGASGEAFRTVWSDTDREEAAATAPLNTFLTACGVAGLAAAAAPGGPFEPARAGAVTAVRRGGCLVVLALRSGPAVLLESFDGRREVRLARTDPRPAVLGFEELEREWMEGWWPSGRAPFLRVLLSPGPPLRPLSEVAPLALRTVSAMLEPREAGGLSFGVAAWEAMAAAAREGRMPDDAADPFYTEILPALAAGRAAAGPFLEALGRALPANERAGVVEAAGLFRKVHEGDPAGDLYGTGLLPDLAACLLTDQLPDPARIADPAIRAEAARLLAEIHATESRALGTL
jgi:hypothetical protein